MTESLIERLRRYSRENFGTHSPVGAELLNEAADALSRLTNPTRAMWDAAWDASGDYFVGDDVSKRGLEAALKAFVISALQDREGGK